MYNENRSSTDWLPMAALGVLLAAFFIGIIAFVVSTSNRGNGDFDHHAYYYDGYNYTYNGLWYLYPPRFYGGSYHYYGPHAVTHVTQRVYVTQTAKGTTQVTRVKPTGSSYSYAKASTKPTRGKTSSPVTFKPITRSSSSSSSRSYKPSSSSSSSSSYRSGSYSSKPSSSYRSSSSSSSSYRSSSSSSRSSYRSR